MAQRSAMPPHAHDGDCTDYLARDDFGELGRAYRETDAAQADPQDGRSPISCPVNIDIPCAWWPSTPPRAGRATSVQAQASHSCA
jgi:hypothetical protein